MFSATGESYEIFVPSEEPLTGVEAALQRQGFTEVDFLKTNTVMGATLGITSITIFLVGLCVMDAHKLKMDIMGGYQNIKHKASQ